MSNIRYEREKHGIGICFSMKYYAICEKIGKKQRGKRPQMTDLSGRSDTFL